MKLRTGVSTADVVIIEGYERPAAGLANRSFRAALRGSHRPPARAHERRVRPGSSILNSGEWFGAALRGSCPAGVTPTKKNSPGTIVLEESRSLQGR